MGPLFVAIEGLDGSGGTTQVERLAAWLPTQGTREVVTTCEPSRGPIGGFIRVALADLDANIGDAALAYLFAADRRDHLDRVVRPALQRGAVVVSDRYVHSSLAYQSLALGLPAVAELNASFPAPDLTIYIELDPEICLRRILARGRALDRFEAQDRMRRIRDAYEDALLYARARGHRIARVDGHGTEDEVALRVQAVVAQVAEP